MFSNQSQNRIVKNIFSVNISYFIIGVKPISLCVEQSYVTQEGWVTFKEYLHAWIWIFKLFAVH